MRCRGPGSGSAAPTRASCGAREPDALPSEPSGTRSRLRMAVAFEIRGGKIATLDTADRERLARLHLALLA